MPDAQKQGNLDDEQTSTDHELSERMLNTDASWLSGYFLASLLDYRDARKYMAVITENLKQLKPVDIGSKEGLESFGQMIDALLSDKRIKKALRTKLKEEKTARLARNEVSK